MVNNLLFWAPVVATIFVPVWGFLLWKFNRLSSWWIFLAVQTILWNLTGWGFFILQILGLEIPKVSSWIWLYTGAAAAYTAALAYRWGLNRFNKILAISAWGLFMAADWWEFPVFMYGGLGLFNGLYSAWTGGWVDQIHHFYVLATLVLFLAVAEPKILKRTAAAAIIVGTVWPFLALLPGIPLGPTLARIGPLAAVGFILWKSWFPRLQSETPGSSRPPLSAAFRVGLGAQKVDFFPWDQKKRKGLSAGPAGFWFMAPLNKEPVGGCINHLQTKPVQDDRQDPGGQDPGPGTE